MGEKWVANAIVAVVVALNAIVLAPEMTVARIDVNDNVFHYTIADAVVQRVTHGLNALDFWMPEWSFGYPVLRVYQPLGAWLAAAVQIATGQHFPLDATFAVLRWLLIAAFPLSVYRSCRLMNFPRMTAAAAAVVSPLIASPNLYGLEYGSYLWRGNGLYTQLVAMHLFVLATGAGCRAIRRGKGVTLAGLLVALTFLAHLIYGYMAALSIVLILFFPDAQSTWRKRLVRLFWVGALSFGLTAFHLVPMLRDGAFINRSRWEAVWKWESFGLKQAAVLVATGELVDAQRLPVVAVLALIGAIYAFGRRRRVDEEGFPYRFAIAAAALWLFLFSGSATWGSLFTVLGIGDQVQTHRFIGGLHWFLIILAGIGLERLWSLPRRHAWRFATVATVAITAAVLAFPVAERYAYVFQNVQWGRDNLATYDQQRHDIESTISFVQSRGGRTYPGLAATWGNQFKIGYTPFYSFLSRSHVPAVAFLYHAMALPADVMVRFDETRPEQYRLFDIRSVVADASRVLPPFLAPAGAIGAFRVFKAPPSSAFDLVDVPYSVYADRTTFYDVNDAWLQSAAVGARQHLLVDYESTATKTALVRVPNNAVLSRATAPRPLGSIVREQGHGDVWSATVDATTDCYLLFKSTYHPNWRAQIDGGPAPIVMLTPGFAAVRMPAGPHNVQFRYDPGVAKPFLLALAFPLLFVSFIAERRGFLERAEAAAESRDVPSFFTRHRFAFLLAVLMLPCVAPLLGRAATSGHDALEYVPRLVEFHENIANGILLPRWAPDLSAGQGQPLFVLNPPLFYYAADFWHLLGAGFPRAINLGVLSMIVGSAVSMFFLGRFWFGPRGGLLSAIAYVYAPYFLVDLYVRAAFAELSAFPFYPLAFYGFARYADDRRLRSLAIGCLGYAAVWFAHTPSAVLFSPLLGAFLVFLAWKNRSLKLLGVEAAAIVLALAFAAAAWVPGVTEASDTNSHRLTEGALRYSNHFVYPRQLFGVGWGYGFSVPGDQDDMPFNLGWTHLLIGAAAALIVYRRDSGDRKSWLIFFALATFGICYFVTPRSHEVWDRLPQLHYVAFPWRLLADSAFCLALLVGAAVWAIEHIPAAWRTATLAALIAIVFLGNVPHARPSSYLSIDPAQWTPQQIAERGVVAATFDTFEPRWVVTRPVYDGQRIAVQRGSATIAIEQRTPETLVASIRAASDSDLELPLAYFPGWHVTVDGNEVPVDAPSAMGRMRVAVSAGDHRIEARFRRTPLRAAAELTSVFALVMIAALFYFDARREQVATLSNDS